MYKVISINHNTWRIENDFVRFFLLEGSEQSLLIDSGYEVFDVRVLAKKYTNRPVSLLNTHGDRDHIAGNDSFGDFYMHPAEADNYSYNGGRGVIKPVHDGTVIELGDRRLEIIETPGHTPGSICILDVNNRVLIAGDIIQDSYVYLYNPYRSIEKYILSLKKIIERRDDFDTIYASHGTAELDINQVYKLLEGITEIAEGRAIGEKKNVYDLNTHTDVMSYSFTYAGFYCDIENTAGSLK